VPSRNAIVIGASHSHIASTWWACEREPGGHGHGGARTDGSLWRRASIDERRPAHLSSTALRDALPADRRRRPGPASPNGALAVAPRQAGH